MFGGGGANGPPFLFIPPGGAGGNAGGGAPGNAAALDAFQVLFGPDGIGSADPRLVEQLFGMAAQGWAPEAQQQPQRPRQTGPPPTSAASLRSLPRIKVTPYDIAANESAECSICLDELVTGQPALRIPCGHLFHEDCVKDWLLKSNECPVCRFELPTDDAEYERGRRTRMAGRKLRMRYADLTVKSIQELQRLATFISVDVRGCLEKGDIVERIAASPQVHIIPAGSASPASGSASPGATCSPQQLDGLGILEVRALADRLGIDVSDCQEKADMISRLVLSGRIVLASEGEAAASPTSSPHRQPSTASVPSMGTCGPMDVDEAPSPPPRSSAAFGLTGPLSSQSVGQLRQLARQLDVSLDGCLEKAELVERIQAAPGFPAAM